MTVYVLTTHWDTPDNEGAEVIGVYADPERAIADMRKGAEAVKADYPQDYWDGDMTWEDDCEIYLGRSSCRAFELATHYAWNITRAEVA